MEQFDDSKDSIHEESTEIFVFEKEQQQASPHNTSYTQLLAAEPEKPTQFTPRDEFIFSNYNIDEEELKSREAKRKIFREISTQAAESQSKLGTLPRPTDFQQAM